MAQTSTQRVHAFRLRSRRDEVLVTICVSRGALLDILDSVGIQVGDDDLGAGVERLLEKLQERV
jgi:hypothetical protein